MIRFFLMWQELKKSCRKQIGSRTTGDLVAVISALASLGAMPVTMASAVSVLRVSALICILPVMPVVMRILIWALAGFGWSSLSFVVTILLGRRYFARFSTSTSSPLTMTIIMSRVLPLTDILPGNGWPSTPSALWFFSHVVAAFPPARGLIIVGRTSLPSVGTITGPVLRSSPRRWIFHVSIAVLPPGWWWNLWL